MKVVAPTSQACYFSLGWGPPRTITRVILRAYPVTVAVLRPAERTGIAR
jgi:hypothetical protein